MDSGELRMDNETVPKTVVLGTDFSGFVFYFFCLLQRDGYCF